MGRFTGSFGTIWLSLLALPGALGAETSDDLTILDVQAADIDDAAAEGFLHSAIAATGCMVPVELVAAFETFLVTQGMADLGVEIDRETALSASFAARFDRVMDDHDHGAVLVAVAGATQRVFREAMRDGRLRMADMVYQTDGCAPTGNIFVLREYTWR